MKRNITSLIFTALASAATLSSAKAQTISTVAGRFVLSGVPATTAALYAPQDLAVDNSGNIYITDYYNNRVRKISAGGTITTIAGSGAGGAGHGDQGDGGPATSASFYEPEGIALDTAGNIYIGDMGNYIRKISTTGIITTIAGNGTAGFSGDGGAATAASINAPYDIATDRSGNIYFCDLNNQRVRKINAAGIISTFAGNGTAGYTGDGSAATAAELNYASGIGTDTAGNVYIADAGNNCIRMVNSAGVIHTIAGNGTSGYTGDGGPATAAEMYSPYDVRVANNGKIYITDAGNSAIRVIDNTGTITSVAGNGTSGFTGDGGAATAAELSYPYGAVISSSGTLYILDQSNERVRIVNTSGIITTVAGNGSYGYTGDGAAATAAELGKPYSVAFDSSNNTYIADLWNFRIRKISATGVISTIAGNGTGGYSGDGGPATDAQIYNPSYVRFDNAGNLYFNDPGNSVIRKIDASGTVTTVAGNGTTGYSGDGGPATAAELSQPYGIVKDNSGNMYIADYGNNVIRKVNAAGNISTIAGNTLAGYTGDGGPATAAEFNLPYGLALDHSGNLYVADENNNVIRKIDTLGMISTFAGNGTAGYSGDGGAATAAELNTPADIVFDTHGDMYFSDYSNSVVRKINTLGIISTYAGDDTSGCSGDGGPATAAQLSGPVGVGLDNSGNLMIADFANNRIRRVSVPLSVQTITSNSAAFQLYPNPTSEDFTVTILGSGDDVTVTLLDITGRVLDTKITNNKTTTFQARNLPSGCYFVSTTIGGNTYTQKLIKTDK